MVDASALGAEAWTSRSVECSPVEVTNELHWAKLLLCPQLPNKLFAQNLTFSKLQKLGRLM
ncbi:hypothetical protein FRC08_014212 [Ceratobasidium sp. 394]|nr:hypothetical protein FRC08_014212 [Ceratobasidium sp. 394]